MYDKLRKIVPCISEGTQTVTNMMGFTMDSGMESGMWQVWIDKSHWNALLSSST